MQIAVLGSLESWYVKDLRRAAPKHHLIPVTYRALRAWAEGGVQRLDGLSAGGSDSPSHPSDSDKLHPDLSRPAHPLAHLPARPLTHLPVPVQLDNCDAVLVRTMPPGTLEQVVFRMDALHRLHAAGVPVLNPPRAIEIAVDKYLATSRLAFAGLPTPPTAACETAEQAMHAFTALGGDVVVKPLFGSEGRGITRLSDPDLAYRAFTTLERLGAVIYQQKFLPHEGFDIRALVLDGRVVAAMRRHSPDDWRTNVSRGATCEAVELSPGQRALAVSAARAALAPLAGVDLLPARDSQCYCIEVNAVPGWRALSRATGIDVARLIIEFLARRRRRTTNA